MIEGPQARQRDAPIYSKKFLVNSLEAQRFVDPESVFAPDHNLVT